MKCYALAKARRTLRYIRNIHFATFAAWREIYITQNKYLRERNLAKALRTLRYIRNIPLRDWRLGEKYISRIKYQREKNPAREYRSVRWSYRDRINT